jgi:hypothetical protein
LRGFVIHTFVAAALLAPALIVCAPANARDDRQQWLAASATGALKGKLLGTADVVVRSGDRADGVYQLNASAMLGWQLSGSTTVFAGYLRGYMYDDDQPVPVEDRARQQLTTQLGDLGGGALSLRLRTEQRWRGDGEDTAWRARAQLRWSRPLGSKAEGPALTLAHESFVNLNTAGWGPEGGYERMRNSAGVSLPLIEDVRAELSYVNQHGFVSDGEDTSDHALQLALAYSF